MRTKSAVLLAAFVIGLVAVKTLAGSRHQAPVATILSDGSHPRPAVLELFTSEGCSSCPPADAFLKRLDDADQTDDAEIIVIEEHVDYWDRLGWRDPFSSHDWTERQEQYARAFHHDGPFTPQFVVNGRSELSGSSSLWKRQSCRAPICVSRQTAFHPAPLNFPSRLEAFHRRHIPPIFCSRSPSADSPQTFFAAKTKAAVFRMRPSCAR